MNTAVFVLSTGRCGTQWLAQFLQMNLGATATVTHEPLHSAWSAREMLGAGSPEKLDEELREPIEEHLDFIREQLRERMYIECGHPLWSALPFLIDTFSPDVKVIHLVRHPVPTAWSWLTFRAYCKPLMPHLGEKILVSPFDEGAHFPQYRERWPSMSPYEKALYYWLEVNSLGLRERGRAPLLTVRFEDLFDVETQRRLMAFLGGPAEFETPGHVDELRALIEFDIDPTQIKNHPEVVALAKQFGFDPLRFDADRLRRRYTANS